MSDVTRALVLPDLSTPTAWVISNMALYWEEVVVTEYPGAWGGPVDPQLIDVGIVRVLDRDLPSEVLFPAGADESSSTVKGFSVRKDRNGPPKVEAVRGELAFKSSVAASLEDASDQELEAFAAISLAQQLGQLDDSLAIAASNNFAPLSHSIGGHLGAVVGSSDDHQGALPSREAALLSVAANAFTLDPSLTVEDLLAFRRKSDRARARFRASLIDLSEYMRADGSPASLLSQAADTFKNRVEPALGDLEEILKENGIKFLLKSLVGATAIAIAPVEPVSTSAGAAKVLGQTIDYSYSKSRLVRDHPYGYLHEVRSGPAVQGDSSGYKGLETAILSPRETLWKLWLEAWKEGRDGLRYLARERERT